MTTKTVDDLIELHSEFMQLQHENVGEIRFGITYDQKRRRIYDKLEREFSDYRFTFHRFILKDYPIYLKEIASKIK